jgi:hypothetical protein
VIFGKDSPKQPEHFMRLRDELWWRARDRFRAADCKIPADEALILNLVAPTYKILSTGKVQIESKDEMKRRAIRSPDVADAFCLTFAGGEFLYLVPRQTHAISDYDPFNQPRPPATACWRRPAPCRPE